MTPVNTHLQQGDALLLIDVQRDFCPGGALPIPDGDQVVPVLNRWIAVAVTQGVPIYASRDWHPVGHPSFQERGGPWPLHCLQDSEGAQFHPDLDLPASTVIVTKGVRFDHDQNSALDQTGLATQLHQDGIQRLWLGGLAEDVCVLATALDARQAGFQVLLIREGTRPVTAANGTKAQQQMQGAGVKFV